MSVRIFVPWIVLAAVLGFLASGSMLFVGHYGVGRHEVMQSVPTTEDCCQKKHPTPFSVDWFADDATAFATFLLTGVTFGLAVVTGGLFFATAALARDAHETAANEFAATHRPRLRVRYVTPIDANPVPQEVTFNVVNIGDTTGRIIRCGASVEWLQPLRLPPAALAGMSEVIAPIVLAVGDSEHATLAVPPDLRTAHAKAFGPDTVVIFGLVEYANVDRTRTWRTAFARQWDLRDNRFTPIEDADYEYED